MQSYCYSHYYCRKKEGLSLQHWISLDTRGPHLPMKQCILMDARLWKMHATPPAGFFSQHLYQFLAHLSFSSSIFNYSCFLPMPKYNSQLHPPPQHPKMNRGFVFSYRVRQKNNSEAASWSLFKQVHLTAMAVGKKKNDHASKEKQKRQCCGPPFSNSP